MDLWQNKCWYYTNVSVSHTALLASRLEMHKDLVEAIAVLLSPTNHRDIPYHMTSFSAYKTEGREMWGIFVFPSHCWAWWIFAFLEKAEQLTAGVKQWINFLFFFAGMHNLLSPLNCLFPNPWAFLTFVLPVLSLIPLWDTEWAAVLDSVAHQN